MSNIAFILSSITKDLYSDKESNACQFFFFSSMLHYAVSLEIASSSYKGKFTSLYSLSNIIPKKLGSLSSIKNILREGVGLGYFIKYSKNNDHRVKEYKLSEEFSLMVTYWYLDNKAKYIN